MAAAVELVEGTTAEGVAIEGESPNIGALRLMDQSPVSGHRGPDIMTVFAALRISTWLLEYVAVHPASQSWAMDRRGPVVISGKR